MILRQEFEALVKEIIANLYDFAALEAHPQVKKVFPLPEGYAGTLSAYLREVILDAIDELKPPGKAQNPLPVEWRPYTILTRRYIEGLGLHELAQELHLSERQLRRDHHRALQALTAVLWERYNGAVDQAETGDSEEGQAFSLNKEYIDLQEMLPELGKILERRLDEAGIKMRYYLEPSAQKVFADRIVLRQILISLVNLAAYQMEGGEMDIATTKEGSCVSICIRYQVAGDEPSGAPGDREAQINRLRYWCDQILATLEEFSTDSSGEFHLNLPCEEQKTILVVDDQEATIQMFSRYLGRENFSIVGITQAEQVMAQARRLQPALISLDVMMPMIDGWEVLQALKLDGATAHIPVIVCSAWDEPELARSLGAVGFLKKPVTRDQFLDLLSELGLTG